MDHNVLAIDEIFNMPMIFRSPEPDVQIVKAFSTPFKNALATARTCYSSSGIIRDEQIDPDRIGTRELAESIYRAGHHTTLEHAHVQFAISNVSRHFVWSFLHSHPFYNSEQVSQRYVTVNRSSVIVPALDGRALDIYQRTIEIQADAYEALIALLEPVVAEEYFRRFRAREREQARYAKEIRRKAQEVARYVLPIGTFTYLYHTVSVLTLLRYHRIVQQRDVPTEQRVVVEKMVQELLRLDPNYKLILEDELSAEAFPESSLHIVSSEEQRAEFVREFDRELDGKRSKLISFPQNGEKLLAESVRAVLGLPEARLTEEDAISLVLDPSRNRLLAESLVLTPHSKLSRALYHVRYTFKKKLSHTADSQDQRHRMTPASRPFLYLQLSIDEPDFITPPMIEKVQKAHALYRETMERTWENIRLLKSLGVRDEFVFYLLPNAVPIRFVESADLLNLHHKLAMRLCYNAQEEIWRASLDEALQIAEVHPLIGKYLLPPCAIRALASEKPICPEGKRFCGEKVWRFDKTNYERAI